MVSVFLHALALLCGLGSTVLATAATSRSAAGALAAGFLAAAAVVRIERLPDTPWLGGMLAAAALLELLRKPASGWRKHVSAACAGGFAGVCVPLFRAEGLPLAAALVLAAAPAVASSAFAARNPGYAPRRLKEEALLVILGLGVLAAAAPAISAGWASAVTLNAGVKSTAPGSVPQWVIVLGAAALFCGGVTSLWRHR